jgi:dicarboxylate transporter 10
MVLTSAQLGSYDQLKSMLLQTPYFKDDIITHFASSLMAGLIATTASSPFDVVKTRVMNSSKSSSGPQYKGTIDGLFRIAQSEGFIALFKGWVPSFTRLGPHTILTFVFLEKLKSFYITPAPTKIDK